jgi:hypothetical protein
MIDLGDFELHNLQARDGALYVRDALRSHVTATSLHASSEFFGGFSLRAPNTSEIYHYFFLRVPSTLDGYCYITDEEYSVFTSTALGRVPDGAYVTYAQQGNQVLVNSPHLSSAFYGIVGSSLIRAVKQDSVNPDTTAIDIPTGIVCSFGNRNPIAQGAIVYFNDPGTEIRTYTGANAVNVGGVVTDMFEGPGGGLYMCTTNGVYVLPQDSIGQGQLVYGMLSKVSAYETSSYGNAVAARSGLFGLTRNGVASIGESVNEVRLTDYNGRRYRTEYVGPGSGSDYRNGRIFQSNDGLLISIDGRLVSFEIGEASYSWMYNSTEMDVIGRLRSRDGADLWLMPDRLVEQIGNLEFDASTIAGYACGTVPVDTEGSTLIRSVTTTGNNIGRSQYAYIMSTAKSATTPASGRADNVIGTDTWSASNLYTVEEDRSRRHLVAIRTDHLDLEIGLEGSGSKLGPVALDSMRGKGRRRPTN